MLYESNCEVVGWGETGPYQWPDHLQYAEVPIKDIAKCRTQAFTEFLRKDLTQYIESNKTLDWDTEWKHINSSDLTWERIRKIGRDSQFMNVALQTSF